MAAVKDILRSHMASGSSDNGDELATEVRITKNGRFPVSRADRANIIRELRATANDPRFPSITHGDVEPGIRRNMRSSVGDDLVTAYNKARFGIALTTADLGDPEVIEAFSFFQQRDAHYEAQAAEMANSRGFSGLIRRGRGFVGRQFGRLSIVDGWNKSLEGYERIN